MVISHSYFTEDNLSRNFTAKNSRPKSKGMDEKKAAAVPENPAEARRKVLLHMVAALTCEIGFHTIDKRALDGLAEIFEKRLHSLGRITMKYAEIASRVEPTVGDVTMAMIELQHPIDPSGLRSYSRRHSRPITPAPQGLPPARIPQILTAGKRRCLPGHIPDFFPPMPDPHTYIRTPTHKQPLTDYAACREKMSQQKRDLERSLSKFYSRTSPCFQFFPDNKDLFPLMLPKPVTYHNAVICRDQIFEEEQSLPPINLVKVEKPKNSIPNGVEENDAEAKWELIDNPFLRPPRPANNIKRPGASSK